MKQNIYIYIGDLNVMVNGCSNTYSMDGIINPENFSNFDKLLRVTAYVMRFINNLYCKKFPRKFEYLNIEEVEAGEVMWIQVMQHVFYGDISKMQWPKKTLGIYKDKRDILRCEECTDNVRPAAADFTTKKRSPAITSFQKDPRRHPPWKHQRHFNPTTS